jgi:hypothetical protein
MDGSEMRLYVHLQLDAGGRVNISGDELNSKDMAEVFRLLAGKKIVQAQQTAVVGEGSPDDRFTSFKPRDQRIDYGPQFGEEEDDASGPEGSPAA